MKKLMIIAAAAVMALTSNAATMKWGSGALTVPAGTANLAATYGASASLYIIDSATYTALTDAIAGMSGNDASKYIYNQFSKETASVKSSTFSKGANTLTDTTVYGKGDTAYAVVIYTAFDSKDKDALGNFTGDQYYIANAGSWTFESDTSKTMANMGTSLGGSGDSISWQAVPEPTSGLLLLLGVAGLALRRKRA